LKEQKRPLKDNLKRNPRLFRAFTMNTRGQQRLEARPQARTALERLLLTVAENKPKALRALLKAGAPFQMADRGGTTPLMLGANGQPDCARVMLEAGAPTGWADEAGFTALTWRAVRAVRAAYARFSMRVHRWSRPR
jgi:ankyrin repeat protein